MIAVSFTRAATSELRSRVQRLWGSSTIRLPHRIVTLDTLICDLVHALLANGLVVWPGGHVALHVVDTWKVLTATGFSDQVVVVTGRTAGKSACGSLEPKLARLGRSPAKSRQKLNEGTCTHEDLRMVLADCLEDQELRAVLVRHLEATTRTVIVDEVFDANGLDLNIVELVCAAGLDVTLIGDPWQALYRFRGARPDLVPDLVMRTGMVTLSLSESFRWRSEEQATLARRLRAGQPIAAPPKDSSVEPDVVLATEWAHLWDVEKPVLPLAFGSAKGNIAEAGATLLLDYATRSLLGLDATYAVDALATLGITDPEAVGRLDAGWPAVIAALQQNGDQGLRDGYAALVSLLATESHEAFPAVRGNYTKRLGWLRERLEFSGALIPGMTVHQAKGREWNVVGVAFDNDHVSHLGAGLSSSVALHRQLYVACTRARDKTVAV